MAKGEETRERILQHAMAIVSEIGFEGLSIGGLAKMAEMSKSGLFAHFESKEDLQLQVLARARRSFLETVITPALREPRGEPRIRALFEHWLTWEEGRVTPGGCPFVTASWEYDDRPGSVRDAVAAAQRDWVDTVATAAQIAIDEGHFRRDLDTVNFAFELYGVFLSFHLYHRLLDDADARQRARAAFERLVRDAR
jgi:AcrR family transcriptional regulator